MLTGGLNFDSRREAIQAVYRIGGRATPVVVK